MTGKLSLLLLPLLLIGTGCGDATPQEEPVVDETAQVLAAFDNYRNAIIAQKGAEAVKLVDQNTVDYYASMKALAMEAMRDDVEDLQVVDKMMVLMLRHRIDHELLTSMSPQEIFIYAIDSGWTAKETVSNLELGEISIRGDHATAHHLQNGKASSLVWGFNKEEGAWKIDLTSIMPIANLGFEKIISESGMDENDVLFSVIGSVSEDPITEEIWEPIEVAAE